MTEINANVTANGSLTVHEREAAINLVIAARVKEDVAVKFEQRVPHSSYSPSFGALLICS